MTVIHTYLQRPRMAMILLGLWFSPKKYSGLYKTYRRFLTILVYGFSICNVLYLGVVWGDLEQVSEASYLVVTEVTVCLKFTNFVMNHKRLMGLLEIMNDDVFASQSPVHDKILATVAKRMFRIYLFFVTSGLCNCSEWAIVPLLEKGGTRIFPFQLWMPVDPATCNMTEYLIGYVYQVAAIIVSAMSYLSLDYFTTAMMMFVAAQLDIVTDKIKQVKSVCLYDVGEDHREDVLEQNNMLLVECVRRHQATLRYMHMVEQAFNTNVFVQLTSTVLIICIICLRITIIGQLVEQAFNTNVFVQLTSTVLIICIICLRITIEPPNTFHFYSTVNYLVTMLTQVYLYCWCGSEITKRSEVLRDALYTSVWYEQDSKYKRSLWIALQFMKRPLIFRAGYYIPLSRPTFVSILRCSYSYFAVLNQANDKK